MNAPPPPDLERLLAHTAFLRRVARGLLSNPDDARDVAQETWLRALRAPDRPVRHPRGWLRTVARNIARSRARGEATRARHAPRLPRPAYEPSTLDVLEQEEMRQRVVRAVLALPETYRRTLILRYYEGLSLREVANRVEVPLETVRTRLRRGLARLRAALDEDGERRGEGTQWRGALLLLAHQESPGWAAPALGASVATTALGGVLALLVLGMVVWGVLATAFPGPELASKEPEHLERRHSRATDVETPRALLRGSKRGRPVRAAARDGPVSGPTEGRAATLVVRDMLDGALCPAHERVRWVMGEDGRAEVAPGITDERGRVRVDAFSPGASKRARRANWTAVCPRTEAIARGTLWVFRTLAVRARLEDEEGRALPVGAALTGRRIDTKDASRYRPAGLTDKDHARAFAFVERLSQPADTPQVRAILLPRIRGVMVRASAAGRLDAWRLFEPPPTGERLHLRFRLRPAPILVGRVCDDTGASLGGAQVLARVVLPAPEPREALEQLMYGVGWGCFVAGGATDGHLRFEKQVSSSKDGRFRIDLPVEGKLEIRAWKDGHVAAERDFGVLPPGPTEVLLELPATRGFAPLDALLVARGGKELVEAGATIHVLRFEGVAVTRAWSLTVERPGIPLAELERGVRYRVKRGRVTDGEILGEFVWDEVTPIVVGE